VGTIIGPELETDEGVPGRNRGVGDFSDRDEPGRLSILGVDGRVPPPPGSGGGRIIIVLARLEGELDRELALIWMLVNDKQKLNGVNAQRKPDALKHVKQLTHLLFLKWHLASLALVAPSPVSFFSHTLTLCIFPVSLKRASFDVSTICLYDKQICRQLSQFQGVISDVCHKASLSISDETYNNVL
jgi:hypothetical protein